MNRLLISLTAACALLLGNAGYAATAAAAPAAKPANAMAASAAKPMNANAATPTVAPSPMASPTAKAAVAKNNSKAASCRDAKGKFIKCASAPAKKAACRDVKGKFIKCPAVDKK